MSWIAVDKNSEECIYKYKPYRVFETEWGYQDDDLDGWIYVPKGTCLKLTGKQLTWDDEPIELKEERK